ncbi:MAG: acetyl/propionyl/methylcrotonyl-CoA carboxylase subunit alpha [Desulfatibacillaceae bacterium]
MGSLSKVLVANRGEIACRILRTLSRMGIPGVLASHRVDLESPAARMASEVAKIEGPTPVAAYLDIDAVVEAARRTGADAVHPGFGFLAENASFARRLHEEGIAFIGPAPETIELMGDKVRARSFCMENGFPLAPSVDEADSGGDFIQRLAELGTPILIKAAAGGGGKGMHVVADPAEMEDAVRLARAEALRFFGDAAVYGERLVENPRHIEVQVLADAHGNVVHVGERECSIQRRFQKIVEECPAPGLDAESRQRICHTAVEIARRAGYVNAGTVEFLLGPDGHFHFLEMNTRIQVEHPVTEMVYGLDLVEWQVRVARGEALTFGQDDLAPHGHAVEARLYAEDPEHGFEPATGKLLAYRFPEGPGIRIENGYAKGMEVTAAFDPMLAKLIAHGKDRREALTRASGALRDTLVLGVTTNQDYLARILEHPDFAAGRVHTGFIPDHVDDLRAPPLEARERDLLLAAAALASREWNDPAFEPPEPYLTIGEWRN